MAAAIGIAARFFERAVALIEAGVDAIVIDTAHGHSKSVHDVLKQVKAFPDIDVVVGNIATADAAKLWLMPSRCSESGYRSGFYLYDSYYSRDRCAANYSYL